MLFLICILAQVAIVRRFIKYVRKLQGAINHLHWLVDDFSTLRDQIREELTPKAARIIFYINGEEVNKMEMQVNQKLKITVAFKDAAGNLAKVDGVPAWTVSNPELADLTVAEDGLSAELAPKGPLGECKVMVDADADLGAGVRDIIGELPVSILAGEAATVELSAVIE